MIIHAQIACIQSLKYGLSHFKSSRNAVINKIKLAIKNQINGFEIGKIKNEIKKKIIGIITHAGYGTGFLLCQYFPGLSISHTFGKNHFMNKIQSKDITQANNHINK